MRQYVKTKTATQLTELGGNAKVSSIEGNVNQQVCWSQQMAEQVLHHRGNYLVRRLSLAPGEATPWHRDPFHRVSVILSGEALAIEFQDGCETHRVEVTAGQADWDEPSDRVHRALNVGRQAYEEITVFLLDRPDAVPQPSA